jgi:molybdopterin-guanine dinucleotide biosynthesis protein B
MTESVKIPVIGIAGRSGSGKTTLIEGLIPLLRKTGIRVAVIKHTHHDLAFDVPGKDSYRFKLAGASTAILVTRSGMGIVKDFEKEPSLDEIVSLYAADADVVIVEGFTDDDVDVPLPRFTRDDVSSIAGFITARIVKKDIP